MSYDPSQVPPGLLSMLPLPGQMSGSVPIAVQGAPSASAPLPGPIASHVAAGAAAAGLNPIWMTALAGAEHGGYHKVSSAGAIGPMQLMPGTAAGQRVDPNNWQQNIHGGLGYFKQMLTRFHGSYPAATAAYNAGPNNAGVQKYAATGNPAYLPGQTRAYEAQVSINYAAQEAAVRHSLAIRGKEGSFAGAHATHPGQMGIPGIAGQQAGAQYDVQQQQQALQARTMGTFALGRAAAEAPYLASGHTGAASVAAAGVLNPMYGSVALQRAYAASSVASLHAQNQEAYAAASGGSAVQLVQGAQMVGAYSRGEGAAQRASSAISAINEGLTHLYTSAQEATRQNQILAQSLTQQATAAAKSNAEMKVQASHQKELVHAAGQSPAALTLAQHNLAPQEQIKQATEALKRVAAASPAGVAATQSIAVAQQQMGRAAQAQQDQFQLQNQNTMTGQRMRMGQAQFMLGLGPVASPMAIASRQAQSQVYAQLQRQGQIGPNGQPTTQQGHQMMAQAAQMGQQQVLAEQQAQQQGSFNQIPQQLDSAMTNAVFSFQHPSGQGLYMRYQMRSMLNNMGRSLFQTSVGLPVTNFLTNNMDGLFSSLGLGPSASGSHGPTQGSGMPAGGGQSAAGQALNGVGGIFSGMAKGQLGKAIGSGIMGLFGSSASASMAQGDSALIANNLGAAAAGGASAAAPGILSSVGSFLSHFLANGGIVSGGTLVPFANGGVFAPGQVTPFAAGGIIDQPTHVPMALMGEAGPEAIMPLQRNANGKLGVMMHGGSGGAGMSISINAPISIAAGATGQHGMDPQTMNAVHNQMKQTLTASIRHVMIQESMPGGILSKMHGG